MDLRCLVVCAVLTLAAATDVQQCYGKYIENLKENVQLDSCKKTPCRLKRGKEHKIKMTFTPDHNIENLEKIVTVELFDDDIVPFIGGDRETVCDKLETENGKKVSCPLTAGTKYVYKDSFVIPTYYHSIYTRIHWELIDDKSIMCTEVPVRIE